MSGVAHRAFENDIEALRATRDLFDFLPLNCREKPPAVATEVRVGTGSGQWGGLGAHLPPTLCNSITQRKHDDAHNRTRASGGRRACGTSARTTPTCPTT